MATAERDAKRARERDTKTVDVLEEAKAYARGQAATAGPSIAGMAILPDGGTSRMD